ncbi:MAG: hypothetical protein M3Z75_16220 [Actinomycetota bacterium]|nr:hypothetical protein [Actinomycetota bacterium]
MTPLVIANFPIAVLFILAWAGIPLWMVLKRPDRRPDYSDARAYCRAKAELNRAAEPAREIVGSGKRAA